MKQFGTIFQFELVNYLKNKVFAGITLFLVAAIAVIMFFPRLTGSNEEGGGAEEIVAGMEESGSDSAVVAGDGEVILLSVTGVDEKEKAQKAWEAFGQTFPGYQVVLTQEDVGMLKDKVASGEADCAFVLDGFTSYTYYVNNLSMYDAKAGAVDETLKNLHYMDALMKSGVEEEAAGEVLSVVITHETENLGKDQMKNFFYTYAMIFALYLVILLYGQMVATNVATEKSSRAMELLITSAKPVSMMFGKVLASCAAGFLQLVAVFGSAFLFYNLNKGYWGNVAIVTYIFDMPLELLAYMLIFFVLGFLIYAFLFGAIGSTVSKVEDINTSVMPLTLLFVAGFMVVIYSMTGGGIDNIWMRVCSYVPFTSPMAMFTRIAMSTVPLHEILISIAILVASVVGIGYVSAKIYRVGVLLYGSKMKLSEIFKAIQKSS